MKKFAALALLLSLGVGMVGCEKKKAEAPAAPPAGGAAPAEGGAAPAGEATK